MKHNKLPARIFTGLAAGGAIIGAYGGFHTEHEVSLDRADRATYCMDTVSNSNPVITAALRNCLEATHEPGMATDKTFRIGDAINQITLYRNQEMDGNTLHDIETGSPIGAIEGLIAGSAIYLVGDFLRLMKYK